MNNIDIDPQKVVTKMTQSYAEELSQKLQQIAVLQVIIDQLQEENAALKENSENRG